MANFKIKEHLFFFIGLYGHVVGRYTSGSGSLWQFIRFLYTYCFVIDKSKCCPLSLTKIFVIFFLSFRSKILKAVFGYFLRQHLVLFSTKPYPIGKKAI